MRMPHMREGMWFDRGCVNEVWNSQQCLNLETQTMANMARILQQFQRASQKLYTRQEKVRRIQPIKNLRDHNMLQIRCFILISYSSRSTGYQSSKQEHRQKLETRANRLLQPLMHENRTTKLKSCWSIVLKQGNIALFSVEKPHHVRRRANKLQSLSQQNSMMYIKKRS